MPKYTVYFVQREEFAQEVDADNKEEAISIAMDNEDSFISTGNVEVGESFATLIN